MKYSKEIFYIVVNIIIHVKIDLVRCLKDNLVPLLKQVKVTIRRVKLRSCCRIFENESDLTRVLPYLHSTTVELKDVCERL